MRQLSIVDKILMFKTLAISKIVHLALVKAVPFGTITQLNKTQRELSENPKMKHSTLGNDYENEGWKNGAIFSKITSQQCSWVKKLYDSNFHCWKEILSFLSRVT